MGRLEVNLQRTRPARRQRRKRFLVGQRMLRGFVFRCKAVAGLSRLSPVGYTRTHIHPRIVRQLCARPAPQKLEKARVKGTGGEARKKR